MRQNNSLAETEGSGHSIADDVMLDKTKSRSMHQNEQIGILQRTINSLILASYTQNGLVCSNQLSLINRTFHKISLSHESKLGAYSS